jgi:hypothetical protein
MYTVYRKTPDMPYKTVLTLDSGTNSFVDESAINGMAYTYKVVAADDSGNVSNPSNEATIGTVTAERPPAPATVSANAYEEHIAVSVVPPELASSGRDIYAPAEYKIQISRNNGSTYSDVALTANTGYDYYFDRTVDGYPETGTLGAYRFRVYSVNIYGNLSATAFVCAVSTGDYATWIPAKPVATGSGTGRTLHLEWSRQRGIYGTVAYRLQISLNGTAWFKPNVTKDPYASEDNYRENGTANGFLETTEAAYFQVVPLSGQNTVLASGGYSISPRDYYYRVMAVNTESGKSSDWSSALQLTAEGTSAQDLLNNSVGWDQIADKSILFEKLGAKNFIGQKSILALIANDENLSDKARAGFQYWALDTITLGGVQYKKGEFRINTDTGDFFLVDPANGISFKASRIDIDSLGTNAYGNLNVSDQKGSNGLKQLALNLVDSNGDVKAVPLIDIGNSGKKPEITLTGSKITMNGPLSVDLIEFRQGGVARARMELATMAGVLSLLVGGLPLSCEGITSSGEIAGTMVDSTWTAAGDTTFEGSSIYGIAYGGGRFVAVGRGGAAEYSSDGLNWTAVGDTKFGTNNISSIAYGGGRFVAVGQGGKAAYSADGTSWTAIADTTFGTNYIRSITYVNGRFVAGCSGGKAAYSTDGTSWTAIADTTFGTNIIYSIAYGGGRFVAVGDNGKAAYSDDGINWTAVSDPKLGTDYIIKITFGEGRFVAINSFGEIAYSADGANWTEVVDSKLGAGMGAIAYGGGRFVAASSRRIAFSDLVNAKLVFNANGTVGWVKG